MEPYIDDSIAIAAFKKFVDAYNASRPVKEVVRRLPNGQEKVIRRQEGLITGNVVATGLYLIIEYRKAFQTAQKLGFKTGPLPSLFTNSVEVSGAITKTDRTVRNHIKVLRQPDIKLISKYTPHGPKKDYELWINPEFLWPAKELDAQNGVRNVQFIQENTQSIADKRKILPEFDILETLETKEKEITQVDKYGVAAQQHVLPTGEDAATQLETQKTCYTRPQLAAKTSESKPKRSVAAKSATRQDTRAGGAAAAAEATKKAVFMAYVEHFWQIAWALLYPKADFNDYMIRKAKNAIWNGVYEKFQANLTDDEWHLYHTQAIERLQLVAQYYERHTDKYPPMPYHEWVPGTGYFDSDNKRGFAGTHAWYTRTQVWKKQAAVNAALSRAQREFSLHKSGKTHKLDKRLRDKSLLQLFKFHEDKIRRLGRPALDKFYAMHAIKV